MTSGTFTYGLLQYHHSQLLGEVLNIGLIVYFPSCKRLEFIYPEKLLRLRSAYPNVPEKTIKSYFKYFDKRARELNQDSEIFADYDLNRSLEIFLRKEFLPSDASALQFGNFRVSVLYTEDLEQIKNQLYNLYFSVFQHHDSVTKRVDETVLLKNYKKLLKEYSSQDLVTETSRFYLDYSIKSDIGSPLTFDVAWQEDKKDLHLVKPVSFDLSKPDAIERKAYQYYGQFHHLEGYANDHKLLFDVILAKPKEKALFKTYDFAVNLLDEPKRVNLIEPANLEDYSKTTAERALL